MCPSISILLRAYLLQESFFYIQAYIRQSRNLSIVVLYFFKIIWKRNLFKNLNSQNNLISHPRVEPIFPVLWVDTIITKLLCLQMNELANWHATVSSHNLSTGLYILNKSGSSHPKRYTTMHNHTCPNLSVECRIPTLWEVTNFFAQWSALKVQ